MNKFTCAANHSSFLTPSTKDKTWCKSKSQPCGTAVTNASERVSERGRKIMRTKGTENQKTENGSTVLLRERKNLLQMIGGLETTVTQLRNLVKVKESKISTKDALVEELQEE